MDRFPLRDQCALALRLHVTDLLPLPWRQQCERAIDTGIVLAIERHHLKLNVPLLADEKQLFKLPTPYLLATERSPYNRFLHDEAQQGSGPLVEDLLACESRCNALFDGRLVQQ